jgi:hypothetical protein
MASSPNSRYTDPKALVSKNYQVLIKMLDGTYIY